MPTSRRQNNPLELIKNVLASQTARSVLGTLSAEDLGVLAKAHAAGQLPDLVAPILRDSNPQRRAQQENHPVAKVLAKLEPKQLTALATNCPPEGC
jgi:hypothetical protein